MTPAAPAGIPASWQCGEHKKSMTGALSLRSTEPNSGKADK
ncbi:hypothetical protein ASAP_0218 [Asaia bogorensis]|uniref:Uncharacterized protein n=1 Tax=Asaia bogorensis TaxID=91915 RepID=A0A060QC66_9PROT|nr:hypothetical protein ASAP_0218 [Asaia bogorensis]